MGKSLDLVTKERKSPPPQMKVVPFCGLGSQMERKEEREMNPGILHSTS